MWYFMLYLVFAVWVFIDAKKRLNHPIGWPAATFAMGPIMLPVYFAKRNLSSFPNMAFIPKPRIHID